jgi:acyl carrier protein phosphodiesterase
MFYDHLLAKNWSKYSNVSLNEFSKEFYYNLKLNQENLPLKIKSSLKYLIRDDWFNSYSTIEGLRLVLSRMESRTSFPSRLSSSTDKFVSLISLIEPQFFIFFEDIRYAVKNKLIKN